MLLLLGRRASGSPAASGHSGTGRVPGPPPPPSLRLPPPQTMSAKEKSKFEDMAKSDKARYDREMKNYVPSKVDKKGKKKDPNAPKRPP